jgi:hypothetical protein
MARTSVKATYALDVASVEALERMARRWKVPKSEALRRAIQAAARADAQDARRSIEALDQIQASMALTPARAKAWAREIAAERAAAAGRIGVGRRR